MASSRMGTLLEIFRGLLRILTTICSWILIDWGILRKPATIADLKFPVLVLRPGKAELIVDLGSDGGTPPEEFSQRPIEGSIVIDSDFRMYTQRNVRCRQGEITMIFRALLARPGPLTYRFTLKRRWRSGLRPAQRQLLRCASYGGTAEDDSRKRRELASQTTMAGIIAVLGSGAEIGREAV